MTCKPASLWPRCRFSLHCRYIQYCKRPPLICIADLTPCNLTHVRCSRPPASPSQWQPALFAKQLVRMSLFRSKASAHGRCLLRLQVGQFPHTWLKHVSDEIQAATPAKVSGETCLPCWRCSSSVSPSWWLWDEHGHPSKPDLANPREVTG